MEGLDKVIHQPNRLRIMAALLALDPDERAEFTFLCDLLELTDGNLGAHLQRLQDARYVMIEKKFVGRKPRTYIWPTARGRAAFEAHVEALRRIIAGASED